MGGAFNCGHVSEEAENSVGPFDYSGVTGMFDRWLAELIRKEREEAWDEGFEEWSASPVGDQPLWDNPYSNGSNET